MNFQPLTFNFQLNGDSFKYRNYNYAIGRFMSVDPLTEKYPYNSTYAFQENKMGLGRELDGLELVYTDSNGVEHAGPFNPDNVPDDWQEVEQDSNELNSEPLPPVEITYKPKTFDGNLNLLHSQSSDQGESFNFVHADGSVYVNQTNNVTGNVDILNGSYHNYMDGEILHIGANFSAIHTDITENLGFKNLYYTNQTRLDFVTLTASEDWGFNSINDFQYTAALGIKGIDFETQHSITVLKTLNIGFSQSASLGTADLEFRAVSHFNSFKDFEFSFLFGGGLGVGETIGFTISNTNQKIHK